MIPSPAHKLCQFKSVVGGFCPVPIELLWRLGIVQATARGKDHPSGRAKAEK